MTLEELIFSDPLFKQGTPSDADGLPSGAHFTSGLDVEPIGFARTQNIFDLFGNPDIAPGMFGRRRRKQKRTIFDMFAGEMKPTDPALLGRNI